MPETFFSLNDYAELLDKNNLLVESSIKENESVKFISFNSKEAIENTLFICKGIHFHEQYLKEAISKGAIGYISENKYNNCDSSYLIVNDIRRAMALIINFYYNYASSRLNIVGITGTKGKSTTCYFVRYILDEYLNSIKQPKSAVISSIETYDGIIDKESSITTPEAIELHRHFDNAIRSKIQFLGMEISSQALKYDRVLGVNFDIGCFLNIDIDHISPIEHKDFEDYFSSKLKLFDQCTTACVNTDDKYAEKILEHAKKAKNIVTFGMDQSADIYGYDIKKNGNTLTFKARILYDKKREEKEFTISMPGLFNVSNALAAIAIGKCLGISEEYMYKGLKKAYVPGRMEVFESNDKQIVSIVDYAHNKLSYEILFESVKKEYPDRKIISVFGSAGKKALDRRQYMGTIADKYSDYIFLTEEDYGEEPFMNICNDLAQYIKSCPFSIIIDRGKAIESAVSLVKEKSIILILGKGRETHMKRGLKNEVCISDVDYIKGFLDKYNKEHILVKEAEIKVATH